MIPPSSISKVLIWTDAKWWGDTWSKSKITRNSAENLLGESHKNTHTHKQNITTTKPNPKQNKKTTQATKNEYVRLRRQRNKSDELIPLSANHLGWRFYNKKCQIIFFYIQSNFISFSNMLESYISSMKFIFACLIFRLIEQTPWV